MVQAAAVKQTESQRWQAALNRAIEDALDVLIEPLSGSAFVESSRNPGVLYLVSSGNCTCPAGERGGICNHRAIYLAMIDELPVDAAAPVQIDCDGCTGCGVIHYRSGNQEPCSECGGSGVHVDRRLQGQPSVRVTAAA